MLLLRKIKSALQHLKNHRAPDLSTLSYAQCGEDRIVAHVFNWLGIRNPSYLDIGAHHPTYLSNTYLFYLMGCKGVCVEPDPTLMAPFHKLRSRDVRLSVGVGIKEESTAEFYIMDAPTLNTFSREEAERFVQSGHKIVRTAQVPLLKVETIIDKYLGACPDFLSIDIEGLDLVVLQTLDFSKYRPKILCVETLSYATDKSQQKLDDIIEFVKSKGYMAYADTYINTVFVDEALLK